MKKKLKTPPQSIAIDTPEAMTEDLVAQQEITPVKKGNLKSNAKANGNANGKHDNGSNKGKDENSSGNITQFSDELNNRELLKVLTEMRHGNFSVRMPIDKIGISGKICDTLNEIISLNETLVEELTQARNTIGKQGHLNHRVSLPKYATRDPGAQLLIQSTALSPTLFIQQLK